MKYDYYITGTIGQEYDWWTGNKGTTSAMVKDFLDKNKDKEVNILVSSPGGYLDEGITIGELIAAHGNCNMYIVGMTASAATVLCMKAKTVNIATGSMMLIHNSSYVISEWCSANKQGIDALIRKFKKQRDELDTYDKGIAQIYSSKNGKSLEENLARMDEEKWMLPEDAKAFGLVDSVFDDEASKNAARNFCCLAANKSGFTEHFGLPGIPVPKGEHEGFWQKLRSTLSGVVGMMNNVTPEDEPHKINNNNIDKMKKLILNLLCGVLSVQDIAVDESGKAALTEEQLKAVEDSMKKSCDQIAALSAEKKKAEDEKSKAEKQKAEAEEAKKKAEDALAALQKEFDDFKKEAGDFSPSHPTAEPAKDPKNAKDMFNDIKDLL